MSRRSLGSVHTPSVGHHRWVPVRRLPLPAGGYGRFNRTARVMLFEMRWRDAPPQPVLRITAWTLSLFLHLLVLVAMSLSRPLPYVPPGTPDNGVINVRFIQAPPKPPPPPPLPKLPVRRAPTRHVATAPHAGPATVPEMTVVAPRHAVKVKSSSKPVKAAAKPEAAVAKTPTPALHAASPAAVPETPPPPKVVLQVTPLSLPEPKVSSESPSLVSSPSSEDVPVSVPPLQVRSQLPKPGFQAPADQHPHAVVAGVTRADVTPVPGPAPEAKIQPQAIRPQVSAASARTQVRTVPAPVVRVTPVSSAPVANMATPRIDLSRLSVHVGAPALPQARPGPLALPTAPQPVSIAHVPRPAASVVATPSAATSASSWVKSSATDQFETSRAPAGKGVHLYSKHGSLAFSGSGSGSGATPDYIQHQPQGNSDVMQRNTSSIHYTPTRFNKYWAPLGETALQSAFRHLVDEFTYSKTINVGRGARIKCEFSPLMLIEFFGCGSGNPPSPPPPTDGDRRLDMAPAKPLVKGLGPKPAASSAGPPLPTTDTVSCTTAKVAGSPPPPGCPLPNGQPKKPDQW